MDYQDIAKANSEIGMINLKGKDYAMVPERVNAFRKIFPSGFITTDIISHDGTVVLMRAKAGYYSQNGEPVVLGTGYAQEVKGTGLVNKTSYIENCETSAVGRALGMIGLGINGGGICSAEELVNAITAQKQMKEMEKAADAAPFTPPQQAAGKAHTGTVAAVPQIEKPEPTPAQQFLMTAMKGLRENRQISIAENNALFAAQLKALIEAGLAPNKSTQEYTLEEAEALIDAMYKRFPTNSAELIA